VCSNQRIQGSSRVDDGEKRKADSEAEPNKRAVVVIKGSTEKRAGMEKIGAVR
jgi:hypothetical protein